MSTPPTGASGGAGLEAFLVTGERHRRCVEILYFIAYYHTHESPLGLGDTVNFGTPVWAGSQLDHGFLSYPYLEPDGFAEIPDGDHGIELCWIIPITEAERNYKKENGIPALEDAFERNGLDYTNPNRNPIV